MGGEKIQSARDAGAVFLKALPPSSRFDIIVFDNVAEAFNQTLQEATPQNVAVNIAALQKIEARGGTETDSALKLAYEHIVKTRQADAAGQKRPAYVLLATDGQIGTGDPSVKSAGDALKNHGICTYVLGIGFAVAHGTVEAIATSGGGVAESVLPSESIVSKVMGIASKMVGRKLVGAAVEVTPPGGWRESFSSGVPESHSRIPVGTVSLCYSVIAPTDAAIAKNASALESAGDVRVGVSYVVEESTEKQQTMGSAIIPRFAHESRLFVF